MLDLLICDEAGHLQVLDQQERSVDLSEEIGPACELGMLLFCLGLFEMQVDGRETEHGIPEVELRLGLFPLDVVDFVDQSGMW